MAKIVNTLYDKFNSTLNEDKTYSKQEIMALFTTFTTEKPKRGRTAYQLYLADDSVKLQFTEKYGKTEFKERSSIMSQQWNSLSKEDNEKYQLLANKERPEKEKKKAKRAKTSYQFFLSDKEVRDTLKLKYPEDTTIQISKKMAELWSSYDENQKSKYTKLSDLDKKNFSSGNQNLTIDEEVGDQDVVVGDNEVVSDETDKVVGGDETDKEVVGDETDKEVVVGGDKVEDEVKKEEVVVKEEEVVVKEEEVVVKEEEEVKKKEEVVKKVKKEKKEKKVKKDKEGKVKKSKS